MYKLLFILIFISTKLCLSIDTTRNSMNTIKYIYKDSSQTLSFSVTGHIYGAHSNSTYPSASITNNLDKFKNSNFIVLLGDNYRIIDSLNITNFRNKFLNQFDIPIFNAIGNHDITSLKSSRDYNSYTEFFNKKTYYSFSENQTLFIFLDTELDSNGNIIGKQLTFLKQKLTHIKSYKNILIFTHKEINLWENNYKKEIEPLLKIEVLKGINVKIISGDMGKHSPSTYYFHDTLTGINYIHSHISDSKDDKIIRFNITKQGEIKINLISLEGLPTKSIEHYKFSKIETPILNTTLFHRILRKIKNKNYLLGVLSTLLAILLVWLIKKKLKCFFNSK